ncbi:MAG: transcriptional regulator [Planctomycetota bacterium]|nr:MAG: transcriptional regulator [Planctomycetota bacterium]REK27956.1 MAG: transcriptional regulator [Planctomycetota bacterium]
MHLDLPPDQQAFLEGLVKAGRFPSTSKAIGEAVRLLASQEQLKQQVPWPRSC